MSEQQDLQTVLKSFPEATHTVIRNAANAQTNWHDDNEAHRKASDYDMKDGQRPDFAKMQCSDSRVSEAKDEALGAGAKLIHRVAGGFASAPNGELSETAGEFMELSGAYKVPALEIEQHSGCGAMNVIYTYNKVDDGKEYITDHYGPSFAKLGKNREGLVKAVDAKIAKDGYAYYENMGIKTHGDDASKFQTCMAIEQGMQDFKAAESYKAENPKLNLPTPVLTFKHVHEDGRSYVFDSKAKAFTSLPLMNKDLKMAARPCGCGCAKVATLEH